VAAINEWTRVAGEEPIPGYRLLEPLGRGGFGEVWKCEVPGGLFKAVKFVGTSGADQELEALQRVKDIRHPFILSMDRVEIIESVLVIVMELADKSLHALQADAHAQGKPGLPRAELLGYLMEAAEALDWMNFGHGLQHLDIKPHNLFLVSNHVKVADFGLVHSLAAAETGGSPERRGGVTPLYASPEILRGSLSRHSDQYSLAIVYQQLLTGTVPFWHQNPYQLMLLHLTAEPCLATLPPEDRPAIARALAKSPEQRFPSCLDLVQALLTGQVADPATPPGPDSPRADRPEAGRPARNSGMFRRVPSIPHAEEKPTKSLRRPGSPAGEVAATVLSPFSEAGGPGSEVREHRADEPLSGLRPPTGDDYSGSTPGSAQPTSVTLPGYRFVQCTSQTPLGDVWEVTDAAGKVSRALCLYNFVGNDPQLIGRLQGLSHPVLPGAQVSWSPSGRLVLVTEPFEKTLRDRFEACLAEGLQGVPRGELLRCLCVVAEALDALYLEQGLPHLGLNPRTILLQPDGVRLADFGLVPLVWMPTGQPAGQLNPRYAAPELFDRGDSPTSDQYSLALIFAEMLSGVAPRPHRGPVNGPGSGMHRRLDRSAQENAALRGSRSAVRTRGARIDLDLLPAADRDVLTRALHDDPRQRFASCTELVRALEAATVEMLSPDDLYHHLPPVIPYTSLLGEPAAPDTLLPSVNQIVLSLTTAAEPHRVQGLQNVRYTVLPGGVWEYRCPVQVFSGAMRLKVDGFRQQWGARLVREEEDRFLLQIDLQPSRHFWERSAVRPPRLELMLHIPTPGPDRSMSEARVRLRPVSGSPDQVARILAEMGPQLFDSIRSYLQAAHEQRARDRWPCTLPLHVYPVQPDLELDAVLDAVGRNISYGGINFRTAQALKTDKLYLHWPKSPRISAFAVLAHVVRVQETGRHAFDVAALFPGDQPPPPPEALERAEDWR
jgi:serine/threonine protein kinase